MDYKYTEDANFFEENGRALEATSSNNNGVEGLYHKLFETPTLFLSILAFTVFIGMLNIWILAGLALNIAISLWINNKVHSYRYCISFSSNSTIIPFNI